MTHWVLNQLQAAFELSFDAEFDEAGLMPVSIVHFICARETAWNEWEYDLLCRCADDAVRYFVYWQTYAPQTYWEPEFFEDGYDVLGVLHAE